MKSRGPVDCEAVERALYCTSPTGRSTLVSFLEQQGYAVTASDLNQAIKLLGDKVETTTVEVAYTPVQLWVLRGTRVG